jgi:hypothetical protein
MAAMGRSRHPSPHGMVPLRPRLYGGAESAIWLARGFFTGEPRRNPLSEVRQNLTVRLIG